MVDNVELGQRIGDMLNRVARRHDEFIIELRRHTGLTPRLMRGA